MRLAPAPVTPGFAGLSTIPTLRSAPTLRPLYERLRAARRSSLLEAAVRGRTSAETATVQAKAKPSSGRLTAEHRLLNRTTLGPSRADFDDIERLGYSAYLDQQLDYESLDDSFLEEAIAEYLPTVAMSPLELLLTVRGDDEVRPVFELMIAAAYRAIFSPRQLFERMVVFWTDHFNIDITSGSQNFLKPTDDREVIREHALGTFPDLLRASAHSPAMLVYLTNDSNVKEHPNENYARELMELHTMGTDNGYTQEDVREVARAFTGWTVWGPRGLERVGQFRFDAEVHDTDPKVVLGQQLPGGRGIEDGEDVLEILATHPNTARFISHKLCRYLWGYEPPDWMVQKVTDRYLDTGGDIRAMLQLLLGAKWMAKAPDKLKRPFHLVVSAQRGLFAEASEPRFLLGALHDTGQLPFFWHPPNGYPDSAEYWSGLLLPRWNYAAVAPLLEVKRLQEALVELVESQDPQVIVAVFDWLLLDGTMPAGEREALASYLAAGPIDGERVVEALGLALASPSFQLY